MKKVIALCLTMIIAPFLHADGEAHASAPVYNPYAMPTSKDSSISETTQVSRKKYSSLKIVSDERGVIFLDGKKKGKIKASASKFFEIQNLDFGSYELELELPGNDKIKCDVAIELGHDTYVHFGNGEALIGRSEAEINYHAPNHTVLKVLIGLGSALVVWAIWDIIYNTQRQGDGRLISAFY